MERQVYFTERGIRVGNREIPIYSGSVHYWRMAPENWEKTLKNIKNMGFDIVETYIPWAVHEPVHGEYDFGKKDRRKDIDRFLSLCEKMDLYVIVRPGPHINAEMTLFGYPEWILFDEEIQAKSPLGTTVVYPYVTKQFPIPSYASSKLYEETECYFQKLSGLIQRHCYPNGGIIAIQADNETCNFFRDSPYILDYSEESENLFHKMLSEKYKDIEKLNFIYGTKYLSFGEVKMPAGLKDGTEYLEPFFDWIEYKEYQILYALKRMTKIIEKMKLPIPVFHNCAYQTYTPISVSRDEKIQGLDVAGIDAYPEPGDSFMLKERIRYLAGSSRIPFVPEFGSGSWFDRGILLKPEEELFGYLYALMNGLKAVNFYMLVERDRWTGCPLRNDGTIRGKWYEMFYMLLKFMKENELWKYQRIPRILVLKNYDAGRIKALFAVRNRNLFSSNCFIQGTDIPQNLFLPDKMPEYMIEDGTGHYGREAWVEEVMQLLDEMGLEYDISDSYILEEKLEQYDWLIASSYKFMEPDVQKKLADFAEKKEKHLCVGPIFPEHDRRGNKCCILKKELEKSRVLYVKTRQELQDKIAFLKPEYTCEDKNIELCVHEAEQGAEFSHLFFAANTSDSRKETVIKYTGSRELYGIWNADHDIDETGISVRFEPYEVKIWKVRKEETSHAGQKSDC